MAALRSELEATRQQLEQLLEGQVQRTALLEDELREMRALLETAATRSQRASAQAGGLSQPTVMSGAATPVVEVASPPPLELPPTGN